MANPAGLLESDGVTRAAPFTRAMRAVVPALVELALRIGLQIEAEGFEHWSRAPSTLIVCNHRRDSDTLVVACVCRDRHRLHARGILPRFVAREDLFHRGFLAEYLPDWPLQWLLARIDVAPVIAPFAVPMRRVPERTLGEVLADVRECCGDVPLADVLRPGCCARLAGSLQQARETRIDDALRSGPRDVLRRTNGFFALTRKGLRAIVGWERRTIQQHLLAVARGLDHGDTMLLAPEGVVSPDGCFCRVRLGTHLVLSAVHRPVRVLPVGISYDDTGGRTRALVRAGPELLDLPDATRRGTAERIARAILLQTPVTLEQLAARIVGESLRAGGDVLENAGLCAAIHARARDYRARGAAVDRRLLDAESAGRAASRWLRIACRRGWIRPAGRGRYRPVTESRSFAAARQRHENQLRSLEQVALRPRCST